MRGLKALVIVMGIMIIAGIALLVYGLTRTSERLATRPALSTELSPLPLPPRSKIEHMTEYRGDLALHISTPEGQFIYFYDPKKQAITGKLPLKQ